MNDNHIADAPKGSCDPGDICAGCRCKYNQYAAPIAPRAKYDPATQPGSPEFDGAEAYQAHLEALYPDEIAPRSDADTAGAKPQTDAEALYEAWTAAINTGTGMVRIEHVPRENFAAPPASSVADAAGAKPSQDWIDGYAEGKIAARQLAASERADAEKDAALTDAQINNIADRFWSIGHSGARVFDCLGFARAILAANGEKK